MVWFGGVDPPVVNAKARLAGLTFNVGLGTGAVTVIACCTVPVPPPKPFTAAAHKLTVVLEVTVGAVHVNVQEPVTLGAVCVISLFWTLVPVPAVNVPALAATSNPWFPVPPTVRV
jgi:hypothetical protein